MSEKNVPDGWMDKSKSIDSLLAEFAAESIKSIVFSQIKFFKTVNHTFLRN